MLAPSARLGAVLALLVAVIAPVDVGAAEKVTVALDFTLSGYHAPWFVAQERGYFAEPRKAAPEPREPREPSGRMPRRQFN